MSTGSSFLPAFFHELLFLPVHVVAVVAVAVHVVCVDVRREFAGWRKSVKKWFVFSRKVTKSGCNPLPGEVYRSHQQYSGRIPKYQSLAGDDTGCSSSTYRTPGEGLCRAIFSPLDYPFISDNNSRKCTTIKLYLHVTRLIS